MSSSPPVSVVTLVNDPRRYSTMQATMLDQPWRDPPELIPVEADREGLSAAIGLNRGLASASAPWVVFAHQDVLFPRGWWHRVARQLGASAANTAVAGLVGCRADGRFAGHVLDPHGHCYWPPLPAPVCTVDEHVIILRRNSGLQFDPANPGFHCYGADIALQARRRGFCVLALDAPVVHLSGGTLNASFDDASHWLLQKWGGTMGGVIPTCAKLLAKEHARAAPRRLWAWFGRRVRSARVQCSLQAFATPGWGDAAAGRSVAWCARDPADTDAAWKN